MTYSGDMEHKTVATESGCSTAPRLGADHLPSLTPRASDGPRPAYRWGRGRLVGPALRTCAEDLCRGHGQGPTGVQTGCCTKKAEAPEAHEPRHLRGGLVEEGLLDAALWSVDEALYPAWRGARREEAAASGHA